MHLYILLLKKAAFSGSEVFPMQHRRLYIVGIDSAPLWIIKRLYKKYKMDGFKPFFDLGFIYDLESSLPPITPVAWPTIYTGKSPAEHGAHDFFTMTEKYEKKLIYYDTDLRPPFWDVISDKGIKSLIINPPAVVRPSRKANVDMVTGFPLPQSYSSEALESEAASSGFSGEPEIEEGLRNGSLQLHDSAYLYSESIRKRAEFSSRLIGSNDYGLVFVCFTETDRMQHYTLGRPEWEDYIVPLYKGISDFIEWLIAYNKKRKGEWSLMLVSDHGAQPTHSKFLVNSWLLHKGHISLKNNGLNADWNKTDGNGIGAAFRFGHASEPDESEKLLCAASGSNSIHAYCADMKGTRAFASLSNNPVGSIWINDRRFSEPAILDSKGRTALIKELSEDLKSIKDSKGKRIVRKIHDTRSYYGKAGFIVPDIMFEMSEGYTVDVSSHSEAYVYATERSRSGDHTRYGIIGAYPKRHIRLKPRMSVADMAEVVTAFYSGSG